MKLTVVGCSGSFPSAESACSSYLVEAGGYRLLLDMGNGALGELQRHSGLYDLDAVALSHLHPDHCIDMCGYFVARYYRHEGGRCEPIPVYGPRGTERRLTVAYGDTPSDSAMSEVFDFRALTAGGAFELGPFSVRTEEVAHPVESYAFRVTHRESGRTLVYSGDTGTCGALTELARDADLFLCEASFTDGKEDIPGLHLNGREAGECAQDAGVERLVLTHVPPWTDAKVNLRDAKDVFEGPVELARPGAVYEL
ncbi:MBL fold metallo-hydrolase [Streptomyces abyssalis]|uniref:MBL fold metallo-hydrolase n=1 Tax=Streptomyces abyssalis TaxID=933944 RepID=A0A1E7JJD5_9ACTN|nr:MBL fold metallo-hydrolase [Streptomyces abyssalis]OEU87225.1 MBL fold metallo-hydrolase [Streptomyces abyssalis]OEU87757.1 MBL fold metallo-hydrolase [Streptomyces abyssalis]OEV29232.1 MBL fold metallo-hydrolase [Streptomyces nanshensis]